MPASQPFADASGCYFDFSASGMVCQVRLLARAVARHRGDGLNPLVVCVEKSGDFWCKKSTAAVGGFGIYRRGNMVK